MQAFKQLFLAAIIYIPAISASNAGVLDSFADYQSDYNNTPAGQNISVFQAVDVGSVSAIEYDVGQLTPAADVIITLTAADDGDFLSDATSYAMDDSGTLKYSADSGVEGSLSLEYFNDSNPVVAWDFTDGGFSTAFYIDVVKSSEGFTSTITIQDIYGDTAVGDIVASSTDTGRVWLDLAVFSTIDLEKVVNVNLEFSTGTDGIGGDFTLAEIGTVPEPTALAILGLGLLGFAASRKVSE